MARVQEGINTFFLLLSGVLVFIMQSGFAMLCAGSVHQKNVKNIMLKNLLDACGGALGFWTVGYAFAYDSNTHGNTSFIGSTNFFLRDFSTGGEFMGWFFQVAFAATAATIVAGTVAERCKMQAYLFYYVFLTGFVYPVIVRSEWSGNGFLTAFRDDLSEESVLSTLPALVLYTCAEGALPLLRLLFLDLARNDSTMRMETLSKPLLFSQLTPSPSRFWVSSSCGSDGTV